MTPQEEQLLNSLVERVNQTQLQEKDPDAEALLNQTLGANPDSLYILAQAVLVQNIALDQAKAQVAQLQQQAQQARQPAHATSFLGSLLGRHDPEPAPAPQPPPYQPVNPQYTQTAAPPQYAQPQYAQPQYVPVGGGQPSFLRGAMQTAAGVAAGALAFEGVESILHGFGHPGYGMGMGPGLGTGMMGAGFDRPVEETVINNNYYDDPNQQQGMEHHEPEHGGEQHFHESADQGANQGGAQVTDASYNTGDDRTAGNDDQGGYDDQSGDDQGSYDQASNDDSGGYDDAGGDDGSGFDDGGGFDGGGDLS